MIPPGFVHELLARVDIVDVVSRHVQLRKAGANLSGLCPFHAEKSPSFTVSPSKQFYHCFGCGAHGDAIRFLMEHAGLGFVEAVEELAQQAGLTVPRDDRDPPLRAREAAHRERESGLCDMLERAAAYYRRQLRESPRAIEYLKSRGLSGEIAARFGLGYAPDRWRGLASAFPEYDDPVLEECGLVIAKSDDETTDGKRYDRFRDRIMFPIRNVAGRIVGFGGRVLDRGEPKYLNSPETPVFVKGRELYGLHEARQDIRRSGCAIVVEGYMDVVALAQMGVGHAVATLGTACTAEHVARLFRFTDSIVFSFDGDAAGRRAAQRALEAALPHATDARRVQFLFLPPEHDPDSYIREHGRAAFEELVRRAVPLSAHLIEVAREARALESAEDRAHLLVRAGPMVQAMPEGVLRSQIVEELATLARASATELATRWGLGPRRDTPAAAARRPAPPLATGGGVRGGRRALAPLATPLDRAASLVMRRCELWARLSHDDQELLVTQPAPHGPFFAWLDRLLHDEGELPAAAVVDAAERSEQADFLRPVIERVRSFLDWESPDASPADLDRVLRKLQLQALDEQIELMLASGSATDAGQVDRQRALMERRAQLKASVSSEDTPAR